jgi:hypothetical protein
MHRPHQSIGLFPVWGLLLIWMGVGAVGACIVGIVLIVTSGTFVGILIKAFCLIGFLVFWHGLIAFGQRIIEARRIQSLWRWIIGGPLSMCVGLLAAVLLIAPSQEVWWALIGVFLLLVGWCRKKFRLNSTSSANLVY